MITVTKYTCSACLQ